MRALFGLIVLLAGCTCEEAKEPPPRPPPPVVEWKSIVVENIRLELPEPFTREEPKKIGPQVLFMDTEKGGHRATVLVFWIKSPRSIEDWAKFNRDKWDPRGPVQVLDEGWTTAGGRKAYFLIREEKSAVPKLDGKVMPFLIIDFYLQFEGHVGYVRGIALKNRFAFEYRPLFEEIAGRLRYVK